MTTKALHEMLRQDTQAKFPYLIHISHKTLGNWYYCNSGESIAFNGHTYKPALFSIESPEKTSTSMKDTRLTLSIVDSEGDDWIANIRNSGNTRFEMEMSAVILYYDDSALPVVEELESNSFVLTEASWEDISVSWNVVFDDNMNLLVPIDVAGAANVPGCV